MQDVRNCDSTNDRSPVPLIISRQPGMNITDTIDHINNVLPYLRSTIPTQINLNVMMGRMPTVRASLEDVERMLVLSIALVIMVVLLSLRNVRMTLILDMAAPVSLIGMFGTMYLCSYNLNNLSLMTLTVATGFVVDDAIMVLENISRHIENNVCPMQAVLKDAREVDFTMVPMSFSLTTVFIPLLMMDDVASRLSREFAVILLMTILTLLMVSLTTVPIVYVRLFKSVVKGEHDWFHRKAEGSFTFLLDLCRNSLAWALQHNWLTLLILLATTYLNIYLYIIISEGFFPQQDTDRMIDFIQTGQSILFQTMRIKLTGFTTIVR